MRASVRYRWVVRQTTINSWRSFWESINKVSELTRFRKIFTKNRGIMKEPLRFSTGDLTRTPWKALCVLLESYFLGARINREPERFLSTTKTGSIDWS